MLCDELWNWWLLISLIRALNNKYFGVYCTSVKYRGSARFLTWTISFNHHNSKGSTMISNLQIRKWRHNQINSLPQVSRQQACSFSEFHLPVGQHWWQLVHTGTACLAHLDSVWGLDQWPMYQFQALLWGLENLTLSLGEESNDCLCNSLYLKLILRSGGCHSFCGLDQSSFVVSTSES